MVSVGLRSLRWSPVARGSGVSVVSGGLRWSSMVSVGLRSLRWSLVVSWLGLRWSSVVTVGLRRLRWSPWSPCLQWSSWSP